jgi:hypothetical protein
MFLTEKECYLMRCDVVTGLFHVVKLPCVNELAPRMPETLDLAFRVRRKKFTVKVRALSVFTIIISVLLYIFQIC